MLQSQGFFPKYKEFERRVEGVGTCSQPHTLSHCLVTSGRRATPQIDVFVLALTEFIWAFCPGASVFVSFSFSRLWIQ